MATRRKVPVGRRLDVSAVLQVSSRLLAACRVTHDESAAVLARSKALARRRDEVSPG